MCILYYILECFSIAVSVRYASVSRYRDRLCTCARACHFFQRSGWKTFQLSVSLPCVACTGQWVAVLKALGSTGPQIVWRTCAWLAPTQVDCEPDIVWRKWGCDEWAPCNLDSSIEHEHDPNCCRLQTQQQSLPLFRMNLRYKKHVLVVQSMVQQFLSIFLI